MASAETPPDQPSEPDVSSSGEDALEPDRQEDDYSGPDPEDDSSGDRSDEDQGV